MGDHPNSFRAHSPDCFRLVGHEVCAVREVERLRSALTEASYRLHTYRQRCHCYAQMHGPCVTCAKTIQVEDDATTALDGRRSDP